MSRVRSFAPVWIFLTSTGLCWAFVSFGFRFNLTASMPLGLYRFVPGPMERGALVAACLPPETAREGRRRGYLRRGWCPGGVSAVLKRIGAVGSEVVVVSPDGVFVAGVPLQAAAPRSDRRGRPLLPVPAGEYPLAPGELWLYTSEPRSWDSRYYGPVEVSSVLGRVQPVWLFDSGRVSR